MSRSIIDTRDLMKELEELENELQDLDEAIAEAEEYIEDNTDEDENDILESELQQAKDEYEYWMADNEEKMRALQNLREKIPEFEKGKALIAEDYFEEYAQDLASDLYGNEIAKAQWPFDCIDWKQAADELKQDYAYIEFDGDTWWYRS